MFPSLACPAGCAECKEDNDKIICEDNKCLSTHIQVAASKSECVGECQCVFLYTETLWLPPSLNVLVSVSVCYFILRPCGCLQV